ncbi:serine/threonine-protein kinase [Spirulina sp. CS-785/01]|uniref:serine/threonine protein kinase n=1 Tax=Spirulina sp. CS-785/01 TaxID=3021716 RepID=UPI00232C542A|nr:serine/threonine-protein kinase [Spirulina sp. CS-785/01]MDB9313121.1 serine/threonine-protein kinase [Spirulina sp. CS-785/01]
MNTLHLHHQGDIIANRYQIVTQLGQGGMGVTYAAVDTTNQQRVAMKAVSLRQTKEWKILDLFEREARVLATLNHPLIPDYLDYFHLDTETDRVFYLVQELVEGESLAELVPRGWSLNEEQVKFVAKQLLEVLHYLHSLHPPVIHRDIKPQNIIVQHQDNKVYLVDFGAVQAVYRNTLSLGSTFVGTFGYMPPEQYRGQVVPASDLYSLGCTLLYLLTHKSPAELPQRRMRFDVRKVVKVSEPFADWLERLVEPALEDRCLSAMEALQTLEKKPPVVSTLKKSQPRGGSLRESDGSAIICQRTQNSLYIKCPATIERWQYQINVGQSSSWTELPAQLRGFLEWIIFAAYPLNINLLPVYQSILVVLLILLIFLQVDLAIGLAWFLIVMFFFMGRLYASCELEVYPEFYKIKSSFLFSSDRNYSGKTKNISEIEIKKIPMNKYEKTPYLYIWEGKKRSHKIGCPSLSSTEANWLKEEMTKFVQDIQGES